MLLLKKGLIDKNEADNLQASNFEETNNLTKLLIKKGIINSAELEIINNQNASIPVKTMAEASAEKDLRPTTSPTNTAQKVIPAINPIRVLQLERAQRDGLIPDLKLGSGAKIKFYGIYRTSLIWDSLESTGK